MEKKNLGIKIENESQFIAATTYMEAKGMLPYGDGKFHKDYTHLAFDNNWSLWDTGVHLEIISFGAFAQLTGIELPKEREIIIQLPLGVTITINQRGGELRGDGLAIGISPEQLAEIHTAFTSLTPPRQ